MGRPTFLGSLIGKHAGQVELVNAETGAVLAGYIEAAFDSKTRKKGLLNIQTFIRLYRAVSSEDKEILH
jgi:hypothetical protein